MFKIAKYILIGRDPGDDSHVLMKGFIKGREAKREYERSPWDDKSVWQLVKKEENND